MKAYTCPVCGHRLYRDPLGPCLEVVDQALVTSHKQAAKCSCRHVSHFTNHVELME